jgi:hypothetical protein
MGHLRDISNALMSLGKQSKEAKHVIKQTAAQINTLRGTSLSRLSSAATLQFPIIISRSVNVDTAQAVCKALERQFANFVQIVISLDPNIYLDRDENITGYLRKYHQNRVGLGDLLESCMSVYSDETLGIALMMSINEGCNAQVLASNKEQMFCVEDCLNTYSVNDLYKPKSITMSVAESSLEYFCKKNDILMEGPYSIPLTDENGNRIDRNVQAVNTLRQKSKQASKDRAQRKSEFDYKQGRDELLDKRYVNDTNYKMSRDKVLDDRYNDDRKYKKERDQVLDDRYKDEREYREKRDKIMDDRYKDEQQYRKDRDQVLDDRYKDEQQYRRDRDQVLDDRYEDERKYKEQRDKTADNFQERRTRAEEEKLKHEIERDEADFRSRAIVKLADNDVKKSNELVPTTLSVTLNQIKGEHSVGVQNFIVGIKGLMHPVDSNEMVANLLDGFKSGNMFTNFFRWTSGEITFLKDLILNMGDIKEEVIKKRTGSKWWSTLRRRKDIKRAKKGGILPNASIVCSIEEITEIREVYGLNLLDVRHVKKIMDRFFLLGFVIVDESQELAHIIFDGEDNYQVLTYRGLEKENNNKNDFKEIYKMINSGRI